MVAGVFRSFRSLMLLSGESFGTTSACSRFGLTIAIAVTGMFLSSSEVNGKLPPLPAWKRAETMVSLIAGPEGNACHFASMPRFFISPARSITMLMVFCPDHGAWKATWIGHHPLLFSHSTDLAET